MQEDLPDKTFMTYLNHSSTVVRGQKSELNSQPNALFHTSTNVAVPTENTSHLYIETNLISRGKSLLSSPSKNTIVDIIGSRGTRNTSQQAY